jgi:hypothetical protein
MQLHYDSEDECFFVSWYYHGAGGYYLLFDPWTGDEVRCVYDYEYLEDYEYGVGWAKRTLKLALEDEEFVKTFGKKYYLGILKSAEDRLEKFLKTYGPVNSKKSRKCWDREVAANVKRFRKQHLEGGACDDLLYLLEGGDRERESPIIHVPNIRTYAILNEKKYGGFEVMDYCPFCGAKFPARLDGKLTEILQSEYGLESWKDYKRASAEFHTDEWWRKKRL